MKITLSFVMMWIIRANSKIRVKMCKISISARILRDLFQFMPYLQHISL